jgi:hypothetical protein
VNVPELLDSPAVLLVFGAALLWLAVGLLAVGLVGAVGPLAELAGAELAGAELAGAEPTGEAGALPEPAAELVGWLPELAWVDDGDEHPCRAHMPTTAKEPTSVAVRRSIEKVYPSVDTRWQRWPSRSS